MGLKKKMLRNNTNFTERFYTYTAPLSKNDKQILEA